MISFLRGTLVQARQDAIIIEVSGIGYEIGVHSRACSMLPPVGSPLVVYTYLQVLDNDLKLYGFLNQEELELFKLLLGVSGLGAKSSLNILAALKPDEFCQTVISADEKRLQGVPGIGKKTAQRLVFELKDKLGECGNGPPADCRSGAAGGIDGGFGSAGVSTVGNIPLGDENEVGGRVERQG